MNQSNVKRRGVVFWVISAFISYNIIEPVDFASIIGFSIITVAIKYSIDFIVLYLFKKVLNKDSNIIQENREISGAEIIKEVSSVWIRVPVCFFAGYYGNKKNQKDILDMEAFALAIVGTHAQVFNRPIQTITKSEAFQYTMDLVSSRGGSEKQQINNACWSIIFSELINTNKHISEEALKNAVDKGLFEISHPILEELRDIGFPVEYENSQKITERYIEKIAKLN